jgi:hypothetical protein
MTEDYKRNMASKEFTNESSTVSARSNRRGNDNVTDHLIDDKTYVFQKNFSKKPITLNSFMSGE